MELSQLCLEDSEEKPAILHKPLNDLLGKEKETAKGFKNSTQQKQT